MKSALIKISVLLTLAFMLVSLSQVATALPSNSHDKSLAILSNMFNFDLSKYNVILNGTSDHFDSAFGPNVNQQSVLYTLISDSSIISADLQFVGSSFWYCNLQIKGKPIYAQAQPANVLDQCKSIVQSYQAYATQYSPSDTPYISSMANTLDSVSELKTTSVTEGNIKLNISDTTTKISNIPTQTFKWVYTENGIDVTRKAVTIKFTDGMLTSINDAWHLYSTGSLNTISEEEALSIAWAHAQNLTLQFISENGSTYEVKPDLTDATTEVSFSMQPRNNTVSLYPSWLVTYYFAKPYGQNRGIEVGIWGDTKEVTFCQPLVILGGSDPSGITTSQSSANGDLQLNTLLVISAGAGLIVAIAAVGVFIKRNKQ